MCRQYAAGMLLGIALAAHVQASVEETDDDSSSKSARHASAISSSSADGSDLARINIAS
eukprot:m.242912 g.242912  ORF g.242912 m.242912 type:complete len:59 (+) comp17139_c0_seq4:4140-4316(+)